MTDINAAAETARELARRTSGQFGEQQRTAPELNLNEGRTSLTLIAATQLPKMEPIAYPADLPAGGKVEASFEDAGGVYVSIEFDDQLNVHGERVRVSLGGDTDRGDDWNSIANDEPGFTDDNLNDSALNYLRKVRSAIDSDAGVAIAAAVTPHFDTFIARATQPTPKADHSDEASWARSRTRGEQLIGAFADGGNELEDNTADAIADILSYAKSQGLDIDDIARRAVNYCEYA